MKTPFSPFFSAWTWRMAWRDSRSTRRRLILFSAAISAGVAALVAVGSLGHNLERALEEQAKTLLGADLVLRSQEAFSPEEDQWFGQLGGEQAREISLSTMAYFPRTQDTRLAQVRALSGDFPFYGRLETEPPSAEAQFRQRGGGVLVEETLLRQFDAKAGDPIRLGNLTTRIAGRLEKVPGEAVALATISPRIYLSMDDLAETGLLQPGSLARYRVYFKFTSAAAGAPAHGAAQAGGPPFHAEPAMEVSALLRKIRPQLDKFRLGHDTVEERKRELGRSMENLYHFLNLSGFIALLLGGVGVASAIQVHVKQKLSTVAVLRCLGGSASQTFAVYLAQAMALGLFASVLGSLLGLAIQSIVPKLLADFIPFEFQFRTDWLAVGRAVAIGFVLCLLFALWPLLAIRRVPPLAALRLSYESVRPRRDPWSWLVGAGLGLAIVGFALWQSRDWRVGLGLAGGLGVVFAVLSLTAKGLVLLTRKLVPATLPFVVRQGLANLHRPNNRTLLMMLSLGLGTFLMVNLYLVQHSLLAQLLSAGGKDKPNAVLFDIQGSQRDRVVQLLNSLNLPVLDEAPVVTMRLSAVKGRSIESLLAERRRDRRGWAFRREYRSTYTDHLRDGEKLLTGRWYPEAGSGTAAAPISLEQDIAKELGVGLGDELIFDVQGIPITTRVASVREVEWRRIQPNFFVVFPRGVLESAPAMRVLVTHVASSEASARMQRAVVKAFPNVSIIDLTLVLQTVDTILTKISLVIRFMALFTVGTGLWVLVSALLTGRYQRLQESLLLRTLGASRSQILRILLVEYFALGWLAALTGILLALAGAGALARFVFHTPFEPQPVFLGVALLVVSGVTVTTGLLMSRGVLNHPPLAILRAEA